MINKNRGTRETTGQAYIRWISAVCGPPHPARTPLLAEARTKHRPRTRPAGLRRVMLAGGLVAAMAAGVIAVQTFNSSAPASAAGS